jgi:hypothetical protein
VKAAGTVRPISEKTSTSSSVQSFERSMGRNGQSTYRVEFNYFTQRRLGMRFLVDPELLDLMQHPKSRTMWC